jgi:dienelactone hydrolase
LRGISGLDALLDRRPFSGRAPEDIPGVLVDVLGVPTIPPATAVDELDGWTRDGVDGTLLRWSTGFGADTEAFLLRPTGERSPLPGIVALHCHGGMKRYGKEKIATGPDAVSAQIQSFRDECYSGRAIANEFALAGNTVLVHDAFGWGSRRVQVEDMPWRSEHVAALELNERRRMGEPLDEAREYDLHAGPHEDVMAKTLGVLGTSWGGVIVRDDLIAARILAARPEVRGGGVTVAGLSGGGARAVLATALSDDIRGAAVVAMMSTMEAILDGYLHSHTWAFMNPGIGRVADWPAIAACRAPRPLFVGYAERDALFPLDGMRAADEAIRRHYESKNAIDAYSAHWADAPHSFDTGTQRAFLSWLAEHDEAP